MTDDLKKEIKEKMEEDNQAWALGLVKTLEKENEELKKANAEKNSEVEELKVQIEKMKCCGNCTHIDKHYVCRLCKQECNGWERCDMWEIDD